MRFAISGLLVVGALCGACSDDDDKGGGESTTSLEVELEPRSGSDVSGTVEVVEKGGKVTLTVKVEGATAGEHGLHIHEKGDCSAEDAASAGAHWNPEMHMHGEPHADSHLGDLGNILVTADGKGTLTITHSAWTYGDGASTDVLGKAVVLHEKTDDFSDPAGNSGARIGCAEISE